MRTVTKVAIDETTLAGHRLLRYTARIVNAGVGPFEVRASRPDTGRALMPVTQNIHQSDGSIVASPTATSLVWGGDGHNHWHVVDLEGGDLVPEGGGPVLASAKHGFHAADGAGWDLTLPGAPQSKVYKACFSRSCQIGALAVGEGISVGWMDTYALPPRQPVHRHHRHARRDIRVDAVGRPQPLLHRGEHGQQHGHGQIEHQR